MNLLLVGDTAIPYNGSVNIDDLKGMTVNNAVVMNLEGPIVNDAINSAVYDEYKFNLYTEEGCMHLLKSLNVRTVSLANNHSLDFRLPLSNTIGKLSGLNITSFGTQENPKSEFLVNGKKVCIWSATSFITGAYKNQTDKLNGFHPAKFLSQINEYRKLNPDCYIVIYPHWGYELAEFPQPADREWAKKAIDFGANAVIGHHSHVVQGIEIYKSGILAFSLGNFILPQVKYYKRQLKYNSPSVNKGIGLEIDVRTSEIFVHEFEYDKASATIKYLKKTPLNESQRPDYFGYSDSEYRIWYKEEMRKPQHKRNFSIYPTFWSYSRLLNPKFAIFKYIFKLYIIARKILIKTGIHKPYNW